MLHTLILRKCINLCLPNPHAMMTHFLWLFTSFLFTYDMKIEISQNLQIQVVKACSRNILGLLNPDCWGIHRSDLCNRWSCKPPDVKFKVCAIVEVDCWAFKPKYDYIHLSFRLHKYIIIHTGPGQRWWTMKNSVIAYHTCPQIISLTNINNDWEGV